MPGSGLSPGHIVYQKKGQSPHSPGTLYLSNRKTDIGQVDTRTHGKCQEENRIGWWDGDGVGEGL